ncbi:hypothetical protein [uncultured Holdemania sp.]|uniref:hypothetical protein n=1 Tax=uncultured Holdemania sp. TaxID=527664 RepID=UPI0028064667|nr:hypothetical protein [uncultured Holdemania sp.]
MNSQGPTILCRICSWLLIYLSLVLGCWHFNGGCRFFHFYGDVRIIPGMLTLFILIGMSILGAVLFILSDSIHALAGFAVGLVLELVLLAVAVYDDGLLGALLICTLPALPYLIILKIIKVITGLIIPISAVTGILFLLQFVLIVLSFKYIKKLHWGCIASQLAVISGYALFCFYDNVLETWMLSFFSMLTLVRLAEIPWIWVDTPAKRSLKAEKGSTDE